LSSFNKLADSPQPSKEKTKATGLVNKLKSWTFFAEVALLTHILAILKTVYAIKISFITINEEQTGLGMYRISVGSGIWPDIGYLVTILYQLSGNYYPEFFLFLYCTTQLK